METTLNVRHSVAFDQRPLASIDGLPGQGADLRPEQMRALAKALLAAAEDCEKHARQKRPRNGVLPPTTKRYELRA